MASPNPYEIVGRVGVVVVDQAARRSYAKKVAELSAEQQQKLNADLLKAQTDAQRLAILNAAVGQARSQSASNKIALSRNIGFIILGVGVLALAVALVYTARKKK
jgi:hypothetical protein